MCVIFGDFKKETSASSGYTLDSSTLLLMSHLETLCHHSPKLPVNYRALLAQIWIAGPPSSLLGYLRTQAFTLNLLECPYLLLSETWLCKMAAHWEQDLYSLCILTYKNSFKVLIIKLLLFYSEYTLLCSYVFWGCFKKNVQM